MCNLDTRNAGAARNPSVPSSTEAVVRMAALLKLVFSIGDCTGGRLSLLIKHC